MRGMVACGLGVIGVAGVAGGQEPAPAAARVHVIRLTCNSLVYDPVNRKFYASLPSTVGPQGNSIVVIDPDTGEVGPPVAVGSEPDRMAVSEDGSRLYVALRGSGMVRRVDLPGLKVGMQFPVGGARNLAVLPGHRDVVVVQRGEAAGHGGGVALYDQGVQRPSTASPNSFALSFRDRLYTYQNEISSWEFSTWSVTPAGLVHASGRPSELFGNLAISGENGRVYTDNGAVLDPETRQVLGRFAGFSWSMPVEPDASTGRVFHLERDRIQAFDYRTFVPLESLPLFGNGGILSGHARGFVEYGRGLLRWGPDGLAFRDREQVFLVRTPFVGRPIPPVNLSVTQAVRPERPSPGMNRTWTVTVRNQGPGTASGVWATLTLPDKSTLVSWTASQGRASVIRGVVAGELETLAPGAKATLTVVASVPVDQPGRSTAIVRANEKEARPADNIADQEWTPEPLAPPAPAPEGPGKVRPAGPAPSAPRLEGAWGTATQTRRTVRGSSRNYVEAELLLRNRGDAAGPRQGIRFLLARQPVPGKGDLPLQESLLPPLPARGEHRIPLQVELPAGVSASGKYLVAVLGTTVSAEDGKASRFLVLGPLP